MVERYHDPGDWMQSPTGEYVKASDYDALAARLAELEALRTNTVLVPCDELAKLKARLAEAERLLAVLAALDQKHNKWQHADTPVFAINDAKVLHSDVRAAAAFLSTATSANEALKEG